MYNLTKDEWKMYRNCYIFARVMNGCYMQSMTKELALSTACFKLIESNNVLLKELQAECGKRQITFISTDNILKESFDRAKDFKPYGSEEET